MARRQKLSYDTSDLSPEGEALLERGWVQVSLCGYWLSKEQWIDTTHDDLCHAHSEEFAGEADYDTLFVAFVKSLGMSEENTKEVLELFEARPTNAVEWD